VTAAEHLMTISQNGQVSIPAETRARWRTRKVLVVDLGDRVVMRPAPEDGGVAELRGKYADRGPDTATARAQARRADAAASRRRRR
jgi:bifunctional DNA-binding transcriptional regulator/antitoxin component of YhaV-PrlF toxin-antitoxin module